MAGYVVGELGLIETLCCGHRSGQHLSRCKTIGGEIKPERINPLSFGALPILVEHVLCAWEVKGGHRYEDFGIVEVAVHQRAHHDLQRHRQHADKGATYHARSEACLVGGTDESYGVRWIRSRKNDIGIGRLDGAN